MTQSAEATASVMPKMELPNEAIIWEQNFTLFYFSIGHPSLHFSGYYRKTRLIEADLIIHAVDIFASCTSPAREFTIDTITWPEEHNPRTHIRQTNFQIVELCNRWAAKYLSGPDKNLDTLLRAATHPEVVIRRVETLDNIIMALQAMRITALKCGGSRFVELPSDIGGPTVLVRVSFTAQAMIAEGRAFGNKLSRVYDNQVLGKANIEKITVKDDPNPLPPGPSFPTPDPDEEPEEPLGEIGESSEDGSAETAGGGGREAKSEGLIPLGFEVPRTPQVQDSMIRDIQLRLRQTHDPSEARKLRKILRKYGQGGGARGYHKRSDLNKQA